MKVLIVVDVQNDFCPGGSLAVPEGDAVVPVINRLMSEGSYDLVVASKDWHPSEHKSFASNHPGKALFSQIDLNGLPQTLWPNHCVQGTKGAELHPDLQIEYINEYVYKGENPELDSYSAFFDNAKRRSTGLKDIIDSYAEKYGKDVEIHVVGLATDYCVKATAIDSAELGYKTKLLLEAARAVKLSPHDEENAIREMISKGVEVCSCRTVLQEFYKPMEKRPEIRA